MSAAPTAAPTSSGAGPILNPPRTTMERGATSPRGVSGGPDTLSSQAKTDSNPNSARKSKWERCLQKMSKWCCIGPIIAYLFGVKPETTEFDPNSSNPAAQRVKLAQEAVRNAFVNSNPSVEAIKGAIKAFSTLSLPAKLAMIRELQQKDNCTPVVLSSFIATLSSEGTENPLLVHIQKVRNNDIRECSEILRNPKDNLVCLAVDSFIEELQDKANAERRVLIMKAFETRCNNQEFQGALETFQQLEGAKAQLETLRELIKSGKVSDVDLVKFSEALPKAAAGSSTSSPLLQDLIFQAIKEQMNEQEQAAIRAYQASVLIAKKHKRPFNVPAPVPSEDLGGYFRERTSNPQIRKLINDILDGAIKHFSRES